MPIYIKIDLEAFPKSCLRCGFVETYTHEQHWVSGQTMRRIGLVCSLRNKENGEPEVRPEWCPLVEMEERKADSAPVADSVRHGRWDRAEDDFCYWHECSECGEKPPLDEYKQERFSPFCPNCGARMDMEEKA